MIERKRNKLVVHLARTENAVGRPLFERYLAIDAMYEALAGSLPIIEIERDALGENLISHVLETGFLEHEGHYFRLCLPASMNRNGLKPPARILWYESAPEGKVTTLSSLDDVELGVPGYLLRKYRKLGILKWPELYEMCSGNTDEKLMALKFSNTFPLQNPVPLAGIREILNSPRLTVQSPRTVTRDEYAKVVQAGFE